MVKCSEKSCNRSSMNCYFYEGDEPRCVLYCPEHAKENGFCMSCGMYAAGTEEFSFVHPGYCSACYEEIEAEEQYEDEMMAQQANDYLYFEPPY